MKNKLGRYCVCGFRFDSEEAHDHDERMFQSQLKAATWTEETNPSDEL